MRLWSIHPRYLDAKGLVALWREALLAKHVLEGKTKGYRNHPQLIRFSNVENPVEAINQFLMGVYREAEKRNFQFDKKKIKQNFKLIKISVTTGQIDYEFLHLMEKLRTRNPKLYGEYKKEKNIEPHPMFKITDGEIEVWEILKK
jgi:hypothetical protein